MNLKKNVVDNNISPPIIIFGLFIFFSFLCNNRYFSITEYVYFPVLTIATAFFFLINNKFTFKFHHIAALYILLLLFLNPVIAIGTLDNGQYISYFIFIVLFLLLTLRKINYREIQYLINSYIGSALVISFIIIVFRQELDGWVGTYRYTIKFLNNVYIDPNFLGAFINIPGIICFNRLLQTRTKKKFLKYLILTGIILIGVMMTGSRAAMIAMFLGSFIIVSTYLKGKKIILISFLLVITMLAFYFFMPQHIINRFFVNSYNDGSNISRLTSWEYGLKAFLDKPIIGYGVVNTSDVLAKSFGYREAIHNTYLQMMVQFGLLGFVPFLFIIFKLVVDSFKHKNKLVFSILTSLIFTSIMIEQNVTITFWVTLIIIYQVISFIEENLENNQIY